MPKTIKLFMQDAQNRPLVYLVQAIGLLVIVLNLWLSTKLYPLAQNIELLTSRVSAIEERNVRVEPLVNEFIEIKGTIKAMQEDIKEIKADIKYIIELTR